MAVETFAPPVKLSVSDKLSEQVGQKLSFETCMPLDRLVPGAIYDVGSDPLRDALNEDALNAPLPSEKPTLTDTEKKLAMDLADALKRYSRDPFATDSDAQIREILGGKIPSQGVLDTINMDLKDFPVRLAFSELTGQLTLGRLDAVDHFVPSLVMVMKPCKT